VTDGKIKSRRQSLPDQITAICCTVCSRVSERPLMAAEREADDRVHARLEKIRCKSGTSKPQPAIAACAIFFFHFPFAGHCCGGVSRAPPTENASQLVVSRKSPRSESQLCP